MTSTKKVDYSDQIIDIMSFFDFDSVKKTMDTLDWTWGGETEPPSLTEIKEEALQLLKQCANGFAVVETGGFRVEKYNKKLSLSFIVSRYDN